MVAIMMKRRKMSPIIHHSGGNHGGNQHGGDTTVGIISSIIITIGICAAIAGKFVELLKDKKLQSLIRERLISQFFT